MSLSHTSTGHTLDPVPAVSQTRQGRDDNEAGMVAQEDLHDITTAARVAEAEVLAASPSRHPEPDSDHRHHHHNHHHAAHRAKGERQTGGGGMAFASSIFWTLDADATPVLRDGDACTLSAARDEARGGIGIRGVIVRAEQQGEAQEENGGRSGVGRKEEVFERVIEVVAEWWEARGMVPDWEGVEATIRDGKVEVMVPVSGAGEHDNLMTD